jgi:hypothetical protein
MVLSRYTADDFPVGRLISAANLGRSTVIGKRRNFARAIRKIWDWA